MDSKYTLLKEEVEIIKDSIRYSRECSVSNSTLDFIEETIVEGHNNYNMEQIEQMIHSLHWLLTKPLQENLPNHPMEIEQIRIAAMTMGGLAIWLNMMWKIKDASNK